MDAHTLTLVFKYIDSAEDYVAITRTCKFWHDIIEKLYPGGRPLVNQLIVLYNLYPNAAWDYKWIADNRNIAFSFAARIKPHVPEPQRTVFMRGLSVNMSITADDILNNPDFGWDIELFKYRSPIDIRLVRKYLIDKLEFLMMNRHFRIKDIIANPDIQLSVIHHIYYYESLKNFIKYPELPWDLDGYANAVLGISRELLDYYIANRYSDRDKLLDMLNRGVGHYPHIALNWAPMDVLKKHIHNSNHFLSIYEESQITWDFIKQHPNVGFWFSSLVKRFAENTDVMDYIIRRVASSIFRYSNPVTEPTNETMREASKWVPLNYILSHMETYRWQWFVIMYRDDVTWDIIVQHKLYERANPSTNPNITWQIVRDNPSMGWNFEYLSKNTFRALCVKN